MLSLLPSISATNPVAIDLIGGGNAEADFNFPGDRFGVTNPGLGPFANNGGPAQTHALKKGSPANSLIPLSSAAGIREASIGLLAHRPRCRRSYLWPPVQGIRTALGPRR